LLLEKNQLAGGLGLVVIVGTVSWFLGSLIPTIGSVTFAILLGIVVGNISTQRKLIARGGLFAEKKLLPLAIVLLGVELHLLTLVSLGLPAIVVIGITITTAIIASVYLGRLFGFSPSFSLLMGAGNGICGSSAVAATSLVIDADEIDTGISISIVNLLGTIGIFLTPFLIQLFTMSDLEGGLLIGGSLQAFGQVVAAGFSVNDSVGQFATVVKMGRVLMLGPMVVMIGYWVQAQHRKSGKKTKKTAIQIPSFIVGFFVVSILASLNVIPPDMLAVIKTIGKYLLVLAMAGIGMRIQLRSLFRFGLKSLAFGALVSAIQMSLLIITILLIL